MAPDLPRRISCYLLGAGASPSGTEAEIETVLAGRNPEFVFSIDLPAGSEEGVLALPGNARVEDSGAALVALRAIADRMDKLGCDKLLQSRHDYAGYWKLNFRGPKRERLMGALGVATLRADGVAPGQRMADGLMYLQAIAAAADMWHEAEDLGRLILGLQTGGHEDHENRFVSADGVQEAFLIPTAPGGVIALKCYETSWLIVLHQNSPEEMPHKIEIHCAEGIGGELETSEETQVADIGLEMGGYSGKMIVPYSVQAMRELTGAIGTICDLGAELMGEREPEHEAAYLC
uniref:hypothetical protein n=1 Tax=Palleronia sp. TaxID=1940284 RepID=UPI0035C7EE7B